MTKVLNEKQKPSDLNHPKNLTPFPLCPTRPTLHVLFYVLLTCPFCFSEQDLLDILLVRNSVDHYHCDCCPNIQTTATLQLQIAK